MGKDQKQLPDLLPDITKTLHLRSRARIFLELYWGGPQSGSRIASSLGLAKSSIYYQLRQLENGRIVELHHIDHEAHFVEKHFDLAPAVRRLLHPRQFNELVLQGEPELRKALISAMCAFGAAQLHALAEQYSRATPEVLDELLFVQNNGAIGFVPTRLRESRAFQDDLMAAIGAHADSLQATEEPDGLILFGILPFTNQ